MILLAETSISIDGQTEQLFEYVTNMENYAEWFPGVLSITSHNNLPHGVQGKTYQERITMPEGEASLVIEVKASVRNKSFYTEGDLEPLLPAMRMEFAPDMQNKTSFSLKYFSRNEKLRDSELISNIKENLAARILIAARNLKNKFN